MLNDIVGLIAVRDFMVTALNSDFSISQENAKVINIKIGKLNKGILQACIDMDVDAAFDRMKPVTYKSTSEVSSVGEMDELYKEATASVKHATVEPKKATKK